MRFRNPETGRATRMGRVAGTVSAAAAAVALAGACVRPRNSAPDTVVVTTGPSPAMSRNLNAGVWPGADAHNVQIGDRFALPYETCHAWSPDNPQPSILQKDIKGKTRLLAVVDARNNRPLECNYDKDRGAGTYAGSSYDAPKTTLPNGPTVRAGRVVNGAVVAVVGAETGTYACNSDGTIGSDVWLKLDTQPGESDPPVWIPEINAGYVGPAALAAAGIAVGEGPWAGTQAGGC
jgi:hypothetical protein